MSTVVNKNTFEVRESAHTPNFFEPAAWLINPPGLQALLSGNVPKRYWKLSVGGDDLEEMSAGEKATTDGGPLLLTTRTELLEAIVAAVTNYLNVRYPQEVRNILHALFTHARSGAPVLTNRAAHIELYLTWFESVLAEATVRRNTVNSAADIPAVLAVSLDFTSFDASDPGVDIFSAMSITN